MKHSLIRFPYCFVDMLLVSHLLDPLHRQFLGFSPNYFFKLFLLRGIVFLGNMRISVVGLDAIFLSVI